MSTRSACAQEIYAGPARVLVAPTPVCVEVADRVTLQNDGVIGVADVTILLSALAVGQLTPFVDKTVGKWGIAKVVSTGEIILIKDYDVATKTILVSKGFSFDMYLRDETFTTFSLPIADAQDIEVYGYWYPPFFNISQFATWWTTLETDGDVVVEEAVDHFNTKTNQSGEVDTFSGIQKVTVKANFPRRVRSELQKLIFPSEVIVDNGQTGIEKLTQRVLGRPGGKKLNALSMVVFPEFAKGRSLSKVLSGFPGTSVDVVDLTDAFVFYHATPNLNKTFTFAEGGQMNMEVTTTCTNSDVVEKQGDQGYIGY
jgi:hypothetical protein